MKYDGSTVKAWVGDSPLRALQADYARFRSHGFTGWGSEGFWALALYRLQHFVVTREPRAMWAPARIVLNVVKKLFTMLTTVDLHPTAIIGPGTLIRHGGQIRVHAYATIGADCVLPHVCTIGQGPQPGLAVIGDHVVIGCHATILGPVKIGDGATIAANSLVITDVPAGATAIGVPARILPGTVRQVTPAAPAPAKISIVA
jgi:serine O-acetyltransferase